MNNELNSFPSNTEYNESEKENYIRDDFSAEDSENTGIDKFTNEPVYSLKKDKEEEKQQQDVFEPSFDNILKEAFIEFNTEFLKRFVALDSSLSSLSDKFNIKFSGENNTSEKSVYQSQRERASELMKKRRGQEDKSQPSDKNDILKLVDVTLNKFLEYSEEDNESLLFRINNIVKKYDENNTVKTLDNVIELLGNINKQEEENDKKKVDNFNPIKILSYLAGTFLVGSLTYSFLDVILGNTSLDDIVQKLFDEGLFADYIGPIKETSKKITSNEGHEKVVDPMHRKPDLNDPYAMEERALRSNGQPNQPNQPSDVSALSFTQRTGDVEHYKKLDDDLKQRVEAMARDFKQITGNNLIISSTFRSEEENIRVGGAKESRHKKGKAIDIKPAQVNQLHKLKLLEKYGLEAPYRTHPEHVQMSSNRPSTAVKTENQRPTPSKGNTLDLSPNTQITDSPSNKVSKLIGTHDIGVRNLSSQFPSNNEHQIYYEQMLNSVSALQTATENYLNNSTNPIVNLTAVSITKKTEKTHNPDITE